MESEIKKILNLDNFDESQLKQTFIAEVHKSTQFHSKFI